ncbi:MAG: 3-oxoacyl-ACP reductase [Rhodospirillaceae bacterium TMED8]|nr:3-oxoacyl-ACP reductase [Magnetovibrio sp.]OUT51957.1 MAG: 3-oxoacyl-ACP reductase [Rhodospirillaceae bacterium TMED8]|tara:strand:+ start:2176 stop:2919 length:744 start_codon:yes stop_codon:yes gene_type:complete
MTNGKRTALITGSGRNIGKACALALAKDGYNVIINGSSNSGACKKTADAVRDFGVNSLVTMGDVGERNACHEILRSGIANFGSIDILVNNAAIRPASPFLEMEEEEWDRVLNVGMQAAFWLARGVLPGMIANNWGRIINFAGMNAIHGYNGRAHVSVAKHGAWGLTKSLAKEFGSDGITTNIISPGPITGTHNNAATTAHIAETAKRVPIGRAGTEDEITGIVSLLASDKGAFINGQLLQVNGGAET